MCSIPGNCLVQIENRPCYGSPRCQLRGLDVRRRWMFTCREQLVRLVDLGGEMLAVPSVQVGQYSQLVGCCRAIARDGRPS